MRGLAWVGVCALSVLTLACGRIGYDRLFDATRDGAVPADGPIRTTDGTVDGAVPLSWPLQDPVGYVPIVPGQRGDGMQTVAGSGRGPSQGSSTVYRVTNLNNSGPGSLRDAVQQSGPRAVVFEVSGTINLTSNLGVGDPYLTVAGQTAPSPGITVRGGTFWIQASDVLVQHLRLRAGDALTGPRPENRDSLAISSGGLISNVVVDHCSISWATDENVSIWSGAASVTLNHCLLSEGLDMSLHPHGAQSQGIVIRGDGPSTISRCLLAHHRRSSMLISASATLVNNLHYDWGPVPSGVVSSPPAPVMLNVVGNHYVPGAASGGSGLNVVPSDATFYATDNVFERDGSTTFPVVSGSATELGTPTTTWPEGMVAAAAGETFDLVTDHVGGRPLDRDAIDRRVVEEVRNETGQFIDCVDASPTYRPTQTAVGGAPSTLQLPSDVGSTDDDFNGLTVEIMAGTGAGQQRQIVDYDSATRQATVDSPWSTVPDATSDYRIQLDCTKNGGGYPTLAENRRPYVDPPNADDVDPATGYTFRELYLHQRAAELEP